VDSTASNEPTDLNPPLSGLPSAAWIELVRLLARQAAPEALAASSSTAASEVIHHQPEDRP
jgi:hypothetical protein